MYNGVNMVFCEFDFIILLVLFVFFVCSSRLKTIYIKCVQVLAHIFDELKYVLSMHWMSSRGSERITEQESGQDLLESKREESL